MAPRSRIGEMLVKARVIDELQLRSALAQQDQWGGRLTRIVSEMGLCSEEKVAQAVAEAGGYQRVRLNTLPKDAAALAKVEVGFAQQNGLFPVSLRDGGKTLVLAMAEPGDLGLLDQVARASRARVVVCMATETEIAHAITRHYLGLEPSAAAPTRRTGLESAPRAEGSSDEEEEFKVTDMNGKTVVRRLADIDPRLAEPPPAVAPAANPSHAAVMLEELFGDIAAPPVAALSAEDWERIRVLKANQDRSAVILKGLTELLASKGLWPSA